MILFTEIFSRAVNLFDDPDIRQKYYLDQAGFQRIMRAFLINGKNKFTSPTSIVDKLSDYTDEQSFEEEITGESGSIFTLTSEPPAGSGFTYRVNGKLVLGRYDASTNSITLLEPISDEDTLTIVWYYAGAFTASFSGSLRGDFPMDSITERIINILAHGLLSAWSDNEMNRALELRNILSDADLSFYSPANSARAKTEWHNQINRDMDTLVAELNWRILATPQGGSRFGK